MNPDPFHNRDYWLPDGFSWAVTRRHPCDDGYPQAVRDLLNRRVSQGVMAHEVANETTTVSFSTWFRVEDGCVVPSKRMLDVMNRQLEDAIARKRATRESKENG